jgi:sulfatase modifying factor 1
MARTTAAAVVVAIAAGAVLATRGMRATPRVSHRVDAPPGMVYFAGGKTRIGSDTGEPSERPPFDAEVAPFLLDVHPVTVGEFARFAATGFRTQAEQLGGAGVFDPSTGTWSLVDGADWRHPRGPGASAASDDHPVTDVSWNDAQAYCAWVGKRLPSEIEWEHAARNGHSGGPQYSWGDTLVVAGRYMANTWQGHFPERNTVDDGYLFTSPVGVFGTSPGGLTDMGGNVWQWCADWFRPYALRDQPFTPRPDSAKVIRGGSFLCDPKVCHGFRVSARGHSTPDTGLMHVGFRCARSIVAESPGVASGP